MRRFTALVATAVLMLIAVGVSVYVTFVARASGFPQDLAEDVFVIRFAGVALALLVAGLLILLLKRFG